MTSPYPSTLPPGIKLRNGAAPVTPSLYGAVKPAPVEPDTDDAPDDSAHPVRTIPPAHSVRRTTTPRPDAAALAEAIAAIAAHNGPTHDDLDELRAGLEAHGNQIAGMSDDIGAIRSALDALASKAPRIVQYQLGAGTPGPAITGARPELDTLVRRLAARRNPNDRQAWLYGPAGTGKTTLAMDYARAIGAEFAAMSCSAQTTIGQLFGGVDANGQYHETALVRLYESGGVFLLDEMGAGPAEILLAINAPLANGMLFLPRHHDPARQVIKRHPGFTLIAADNTTGQGATSAYTGRQRIDMSTLDRFAGMMIEVPYWADLERGFFADDEHHDTYRALQRARQALADSKSSRTVTTRDMSAAADMRAAGFTHDETLSALFGHWPEQDRARAGGAS